MEVEWELDGFALQIRNMTNVGINIKIWRKVVVPWIGISNIWLSLFTFITFY